MPTSDATNSQEARRAAVLDLLAEGPVPNQGDLQKRLRQKGFRVTQATLSRDLHALGVVKAPDGYTLPGGAAPAGRGLGLAAVIGEWLERVQVAQNQVVLHTPPGGAQPVAIALDGAGLGDVVGTLAGDDTVLVICPDGRRAAALARRLQGWLGGGGR